MVRSTVQLPTHDTEYTHTERQPLQSEPHALARKRTALKSNAYIERRRDHTHTQLSSIVTPRLASSGTPHPVHLVRYAAPRPSRLVPNASPCWRRRTCRRPYPAAPACSSVAHASLLVLPPPDWIRHRGGITRSPAPRVPGVPAAAGMQQRACKRQGRSQKLRETACVRRPCRCCCCCAPCFLRRPFSLRRCASIQLESRCFRGPRR